MLYVPQGHRRGGRRREQYIRARPMKQPYVRLGHRRGGKRYRLGFLAMYDFCAASHRGRERIIARAIQKKETRH